MALKGHCSVFILSNEKVGGSDLTDIYLITEQTYIETARCYNPQIKLT